MGENVDYVRDVAVKAGLSRTLASLSSLHLVTGMSAFEIFQMDKRCASLDSRVRASFRADFMERKHRPHTETEDIETPDVVMDRQPQEHELPTKDEERETPGDATNHEISHERLKEKGVTRVEVADEDGYYQVYDEEMYENIIIDTVEKHQQKHHKNSRKGREGFDDKDQRPFYNQDEEEEAEEQEEMPKDDAIRKRCSRKREKETHSDVPGDGQDIQTVHVPTTRQGVRLSQHPPRIRKTNRSRISLGRSPSADSSHRQVRDGESSYSPPLLTAHSKQSPCGVSPTVSKSETEQKAPAPEKRTIASQRSVRGLKKQDRLFSNMRDIYNHSISKSEPADDTVGF
jgi:hypothetical protein